MCDPNRCPECSTVLEVDHGRTTCPDPQCTWEPPVDEADEWFKEKSTPCEDLTEGWPNAGGSF